MVGGCGRQPSQDMLGTQHRHCDWGLDFRDEGLALPLPEIHRVRDLARQLALRDRLEIRDGDLDKAVVSLRSGYALARHVGDGPTLIQSLVGMAIAAMQAQIVEELIQSPSGHRICTGPYRIATPVCQHPIGIGRGKGVTLSTGHSPIERPRIEAANRPGDTTALEETFKLLGLSGMLYGSAWERQVNVARIVAQAYPKAKRFLIDLGRKPQEIEAMSALQVVAIYSLHQYVRMREMISSSGSVSRTGKVSRICNKAKSFFRIAMTAFPSRR